MTSTDTTVDVTAAVDFLAGHARLLDRRRLGLFLGTATPDEALAALAGYRNPDGGYGWGLEPDLRSASSQPGAALHAFEVLAEIGPATSPDSAALCDWLASVSLPDGGLPFALPIPDPAGTATWWAQGAAQETAQQASSLQITAIVAACAHDVARHDPAVAAHPWLASATAYCVAAAEEAAAADTPPHALVLAFALRLLDAAGETALLERLGRFVPADGIVPVEGGTADEAIRPLDVAPEPDRPVRALFRPERIDAELHRLAAGQQADGGWRVEYAEFSPAGALEWRGHATVRALRVLRANDRL